MSDDGSSLHVRQTPRKRTGEERIADFDILVCVPGQPAAVRVYTGDEPDLADQYAVDTGGVVVPLPLSPPAGYTADTDGNLVPAVPSEADESRPDSG